MKEWIKEMNVKLTKEQAIIENKIDNPELLK